MAVIGIASRRDRKGLMRGLQDLVAGYSIEVMPRTAARIESFREILPAGTLVYIAHIDGTPIEDMVATARRISEEGFQVMPHLPARSIPDAATLNDWLARYRGAAGIEGALVLAGGRAKPVGDFASAMDLMETGLLDRHGIGRIDIAGHPEGNRDIDPDGGTQAVDAAAAWKQDFAQRTGAKMALVTQFAFDAQPVVAWAERIRAAGIDLPIHLGIAGPAKLQTLIKYAVACGVGPSLGVLQKRAKDVTRLLRPFTPADVLGDVASYLARTPESAISRVHVFPLGGIRPAAEWMAEHGAASGRVQAAG